MKVGFAIAALLLCFSTSAHAQDSQFTGNSMYKPCADALQDNASTQIFRQGQCNGIVTSIYYFGENLSPSRRFCSPEGASSIQALRIVVNYMQANPARLHLPLFVLVTDALRAAWPCQN
ncbi:MULTISPECIES: Rap1a/Tai family immunity protein [Microvirga]|uniref:Rap1a/Tai family immunity protein n=1 Tax=Microvirga TaxID=186650 RepID=UPI0021CA4914|nr:Rap1a/Tai family immunity protein [Microvirga sp. HBU65207]